MLYHEYKTQVLLWRKQKGQAAVLPLTPQAVKSSTFLPHFLFLHQPGPSLSAKAADTSFVVFGQHSEETGGLQNTAEGTTATPPGSGMGG